MAFCAIIHHFRPDLIDFDSLQPSDVVGNCKIAFETAASLGLPKLIDPNDMIVLNVPDKLSVMTYLYQLRSFFTGKTVAKTSSSTYSCNSSSFNEVEEECEDDLEQNNLFSKQNIYNVKSRCLDLFSRLDELDNAAFMHQHFTAGQEYNVASSTPTTEKLTSAYQQFNLMQANDYLVNKQNNNVTNNSTSPVSKHLQAMNGNVLHTLQTQDSKDNQKLMTRRQLMNPFDSDSDEEIEFVSKFDTKCMLFCTFVNYSNFVFLLSSQLFRSKHAFDV